MIPLTKLQLDLVAAHGCQTPGCKHQHDQTFYLHQRCHPTARLEVSYNSRTGLIYVACAECHLLVETIAVKES